MTKRELMKAIPNHRTVKVVGETKKIDGITTILWGITRDSDCLWVDYETEKFGRWGSPWVDLSKEMRNYVYEQVEKSLAKGDLCIFEYL